jgi:protein-L-isoaspartate(D-aspartate) O-methyltransferase
MNRLHEDTSEHQQLRRNLVDHLFKHGIEDQRVLDAIATIPRQFFMLPQDEAVAYVDRAFPIGEGQTISQPYTVAYQTQLLEVEPGMKVLEIGTGSGYQATVLAVMGADLYTVERQKKLFDRNRSFDYLRSFGNISFYYGDGYEGLPNEAPFDRILITAAATEVPQPLVNQLARGGKMVLPLGEAPVQRMVRITKHNDGTLSQETFDKFSFVPMLKGKQE